MGQEEGSTKLVWSTIEVGSSSFTIEAIDLLRNLHLKHDQFFASILCHMKENQQRCTWKA